MKKTESSATALPRTFQQFILDLVARLTIVMGSNCSVYRGAVINFIQARPRVHNKGYLKEQVCFYSHQIQVKPCCVVLPMMASLLYVQCEEQVKKPSTITNINQDITLCAPIYPSSKPRYVYVTLEGHDQPSYPVF